MIIFISVLLLILIAHEIYAWIRKVKRYPPGPMPLPLLGNWQIGVRSLKLGGLLPAMKSFQQDYGDVFTLWIGPIPTVHICNYELAREQMVTNGLKYAARAKLHIMKLVRYGDGFSDSNGEKYEELKKFTYRIFRDFGAGCDKMEERILEEFHEKFAKVNQKLAHGDHLVNLSEMFDTLVGDIINVLLFSTRFSEENSQHFWQLKNSMDKMLEELTFFDVYCSEKLMLIPYFHNLWTNRVKPLADVAEFAEKRIKERRELIAVGKYILNGDTTDFVDAYLHKMKTDHEEGNSYFSDRGLAVALMDLWAAGLTTTSATLSWAVVHLVNNAQILAEVREEIRKVTGGVRDLVGRDKSATPLLNAVILKSMRMDPAVVLNFWRNLSEDTVVDGHNIPANTAVAAELSLIVQSSKTFQNVDKFEPRRCIGPENKANEIVAFGLGHRSCIGEKMARQEIYLILGNFVQYYVIKPFGDLPTTKTICPDSFFNRPHPLTLRLEKI